MRQSDILHTAPKTTNLLLLHILRLVEEEIGCELLILVACKVGLNDKVSLESEAAKLWQY
jgi:hypothetical protein